MIGGFSMKCPICEHDFENLTGLKLHVQRMHVLNSCPICNKPVKCLLKHLGSQHDRKHITLYAILAKSHSAGKYKSMIKEIRDRL